MLAKGEVGRLGWNRWAGNFFHLLCLHPWIVTPLPYMSIQYICSSMMHLCLFSNRKEETLRWLRGSWTPYGSNVKLPESLLHPKSCPDITQFMCVQLRDFSCLMMGTVTHGSGPFVFLFFASELFGPSLASSPYRELPIHSSGVSFCGALHIDLWGYIHFLTFWNHPTLVLWCLT